MEAIFHIWWCQFTSDTSNLMLWIVINLLLAIAVFLYTHMFMCAIVYSVCVCVCSIQWYHLCAWFYEPSVYQRAYMSVCEPHEFTVQMSPDHLFVDVAE